jgi:TusA-related sulfurtransferase
MLLANLFRWNTGPAATQRERGSGSVSEKIELPGHGEVIVGCRLSCEGEGCPRPQLRALKALDEHERGVVIEIVTDNPSVMETIPSMMDMFEGKHLATLKDKANWRIFLRRSA